jgi:hypothetical protein
MLVQGRPPSDAHLVGRDRTHLTGTAGRPTAFGSHKDAACYTQLSLRYPDVWRMIVSSGIEQPEQVIADMLLRDGHADGTCQMLLARLDARNARIERHLHDLQEREMSTRLTTENDWASATLHEVDQLYARAAALGIDDAGQMTLAQLAYVLTQHEDAAREDPHQEGDDEEDDGAQERQYDIEVGHDEWNRVDADGMEEEEEDEEEEDEEEEDDTVEAIGRRSTSIQRSVRRDRASHEPFGAWTPDGSGTIAGRSDPRRRPRRRVRFSPSTHFNLHARAQNPEER